MKGILIFISLFIGLSLTLHAQDRRVNTERFKKIEAAKVAYLTKELSITPVEAERFFPVYHQYQDHMRQLIRRKRENTDKRRDELKLDEDVLAMKKKYQQSFTPILGEERSSRFFELERKFREELFKELQQRRKHD